MLKLQFILLAVCHMHGIHSAWDVMYPDKVQTVRGSCLLIPCTFSYPSDISASSGIVMIWYKDYESSRKVVYHSNNANDALFHDRVHMLGDYNAKNCTVLINNIRNEDAGVYHFRFEIKNANQWSAVRGVTVTVTDEPIIPEVVFPSPIVEEQNVTFQCSTPYFCPDGSVVLGWEGYATKRSFLSGNVQLDTSGILNEQNLATRFSWMDNQKVIRCEVSVGPQKAVKDVALIVEHAPKEVSILMKPSGKNIKQGDNVTLTCHVNSSYPAGREYTWYRNKELTFTGPSVYFQRISRNDFGEYSCKVQNTIGSGASDTIRLVVFSAITSVSPSSEVREGQNVTLTCDVPGATPEEVHYSWYKNSILIKEITTRSLLFSEVTVSDIGYYNCRIQNDKGSDSSPPITLNVLYTPRVPALNSFLETQEGKLAIIECKVDSNPVSELMLYKNGILITTTTSQGAINQRINVISTQNSLKLEIRDVMLSNEGTYRCTAKNDIGNSTAILQLTVESARVGISPSSETEEGKEVTLTCLATRSSQKDVTYTWYKNGKWLKKDSVRNTIIFHRVSTQDAGSYYCIVQSSQGTSSSPPRTLHVFFPPKDLSITSLVSTKGKNMGFILCTVESDPHSELFIYRKESLVASSTKVLSNRKYIVSSSTNSLKLEIRDVLIEDEGTYTCIANNTYGQTTGSLDFATETAKLIVLPSSEVREEDTVNVTCMLSSDSEEGTYTYTWYKNSDWYSEGPEHYLVFRRIKSSDSGSYSCRVWNNETSKSSAMVGLNVAYLPRNTQLKSFLDTEEGKTAFIQCTVESYPPAEMLLYRNNILLLSSSNHSYSNPRYSVSISRNTLKLDILNVKMEDEGKYTCNSTNFIGSTSETIYFNVQSGRILVSPSPDINEEEKVTLTCQITKSQTRYTWYKNSRFYQETSDNTLVFDKIKARDSGYYYCRAWGSEDNILSPSVSLHVSYAPREPILSSFWESDSGHVGIIQCSVDSDPPSRLSLFRRETLVGSTDSSRSSNKRMTVSSSENLLKVEIRDVMLEDEGDYLCSASNSIGNSSSMTSFTAQTTRIQISPSSVVPEGIKVNLTCVVSTDAPDKVTYGWYKNGNKYPGAATKTLVFGTVSSEDGGSYYCTVQSDKGSKSSSSVTLSVTYAPRNAFVQSFLETKNGNVAIILCAVDSNPPAEMTLYKDLHLVASSDSSGMNYGRFNPYFSSNALRLEINNLIPSDEGTYTFTAKNFYGTTTASVNFTVGGARVSVSPSSELQEGYSVTLTCEVLTGAQPVVTYTWYKNGRWFQDGSAGSLVFGRVRRSDGGSYSCTAHTSKDSWTSPPTTLYVLYSPRNLTLTSFLETQTRRLGVILCSVNSEPPSDLSLYKGDQVMASSDSNSFSHHVKLSVSRNSLRLEIYEMTMEDQGEYVCRANNSLGESEKSMYFSVQTARLVAVPSTEVQEGAAVTLICEIVSQEERSYVWYKNSKWLKEGPEASLVLLNVTSSDAGSYHCQANHEGQNSISPLVGIHVLYAPRNAYIRSFLETKNGHVAIIVCAVDSNPPSEITLYKDHQLLASSDTSGRNLGRFNPYFSSNTLRLEISNLMPSDEGTYQFTAKNVYGTSTASMNFIMGGARVLVSPASELQEGYSVTLTCEVLTGLQPVVAYTWYKNSRWFQEGSAGSLVFERVSRNDGGSYSCTAHSSKDSWTSSPSTLYVLYSPRNLSLTSFLETQTRRLGVILCSVDSEPPSDLSLYKGDQVMASSDFSSFSHHVKPSVSRNSLRLEIYEMTMEDQVEYVCRANNSLGESEKSIYFSVQTARLVVSPSAEVQEGATVTLTCEISSREESSYVWYKNNKWLKESSEAFLVLLRVTSSDAGSYHCQAKTGGQNSISPLVGIKVLYSPRNVLIKSFLETHGREQAIIMCSVSSEPASVIGLYRRDVLLASSMEVQPDQGQKLWSLSSHNYLKLEIRDIGAEDSGSYVCIANNTLGTAISSTLLNINDKEALAYKVVVCITIPCIVLLIVCIVVLQYRKTVKEKYKIPRDKESLEMDSKSASQNNLTS